MRIFLQRARGPMQWHLSLAPKGFFFWPYLMGRLRHQYFEISQACFGAILYRKKKNTQKKVFQTNAIHCLKFVFRHDSVRSSKLQLGRASFILEDDCHKWTRVRRMVDRTVESKQSGLFQLNEHRQNVSFLSCYFYHQLLFIRITKFWKDIL